MCELALIGAQAKGLRLLGMISGLHHELEVQLVEDAWARRYFPETDSVARVTWNGCSCSLLKGLGSSGQARSEAHVAGPGYAFRRGIAATVMAFGGARLLIAKNQEVGVERPRRANLAQFLRFGVSAHDAFIAIVP
jgi:hypothetical protein